MVVLLLIVIGLACGSFTNALVWRIHEQDKLDRKKKQLTKRALSKLSIVNGRSMCPNCHHTLAAIDLIPIFSWLSLRGKCRYCHKPISIQYPIVEAMTALLFIASFYLWPMSVSGKGLFVFVLWLIFLTGFIALAIYDLRWFVLPNRIIYPLIILAVIQVIIVSTFFKGGSGLLLGSVWGALIGGGVFYILFQISNGRWIGGGDVKLGTLLGIIVGGPAASILLLFSSSLLGTLYSLPLLITGKVKRDSKIPYGPFLLVAAMITVLFGTSIINWLKIRALLPIN